MESSTIKLFSDVDPRGQDPNSAVNQKNREARDFEKLVELFGHGDRPDVRRAFYAVIVRAMHTLDPSVRRDVSRIANLSLTKTAPGRYFCVAIGRYCSERGIDLFNEPKLF